MPNWKDLLANRNRRQFPEVVVPLASSLAPHESITEPNAKNKDLPSAGSTKSNTSVDRGSLQEKGVSGVPQNTTKLTLEALRTEVEEGVGASGHDTVYDRMSLSDSALHWKSPRVLAWDVPVNPPAL